MGSISRDPTLPNARRDPNFSTGCIGDSGGPVFYEAQKNKKYELLGILHSGPSVCGNASVSFQYELAALMQAVQTNCVL